MPKNQKPKLEWRTEKRRVSDLKEFEGNPQVQSDWSKKKLVESITDFGLTEVPIIDTDNVLLAGHGRKQALISLGKSDDEIDVRVPSRPLTKQECKRYLLISNAVHGHFDNDLLRKFDMDIVLDVVDPDTLSQMWDDHLEVEDDDWDDEVEIKKVKKSTVKIGELYALGDHRLYVGDGTDESVVKKLVGNECIDFVDIDPPFNIKYSYKGSNGKYGGSEKDDKSPEEYKKFLCSLIQNAITVSKEDAHYIMWCDERWVFLLQVLYQELSIESRRLCVWAKNNSMPTPSIAFNKMTEFACYGTRGTPYINDKAKNLNTIMNKEVGNGNRAIEDIMDLFSIWLVSRLPGADYEHPTQKPPTLHEKALRRCTRVNDAVLDLCAGSGSLMVACEAMKRRAFLCEVDPIFATLIVNRYEKISGKKARKLN